jgi:putative SOS response-associated peptidase YedK
MCVNFTPAQLDRLLRMAGMPKEVRDLDYPKETWPMYRAPMVRTVADLEALKNPTMATVDGVKFRVDAAYFGMIPPWAKADEVLKNRSTHNARSETIHEKPTYKAAWARCQFALIPMTNFREPYYGPERKNKKSVQWEIQRKDREIFMVAAIWSEWTNHQTGEVLLSYSCITINADTHPIMKQFHKDGDEPRSLVVIPPEHREAWVTETNPDKARRFLVGFDADGFEAGPVLK